MPLDFDKHAQVGKEFLDEVDMELHTDSNPERAGRILFAVFHTLREYLTLEENFHLMAQLPMALKGVYVSGWSPSKKIKKVKTKEGFIEEVLRREQSAAWKDNFSFKDAEESVKGVFGVLKRYVSEGEIKDMIAVLPGTIKDLFRDSPRYRKVSV